MSVESCFWALLSLNNFDFIYLPNFITDTQIGFGKTPGDILLHNSLLEYIHPEELSLAEIDLMNFVRNKTLAGAVTRCRLKSVKSIIYQQYGECNNMDNLMEDWIITDVVMYTATNNTILTFFHSHTSISTTTILPSSTTLSCCGSQQMYLSESNSLLKLLEMHLLPMKLEDRFRIFQIHDTSSKQLIISCPSSLYTLDDNVRIKFIKGATELANTSTLREINKNREQPQLKIGTAACTHHSYSNSTTLLEPYGLCQIESIIIIYGSLTFSTYQVTPIIDNNTSSFQHYMRLVENDGIVKNKVKRKSNINDILNVTPSSSSSTTTSTTTNTVTSIPNRLSIDTTPINNKSPLPRAWRGRFGAYEKKCENCQASTSPEWRKGPSGHKTLCNACGLRYARLIAKHEKRQAPSREEEDRSTFTNNNNNNNIKLKNSNMTTKRKSS